MERVFAKDAAGTSAGRDVQGEEVILRMGCFVFLFCLEMGLFSDSFHLLSCFFFGSSWASGSCARACVLKVRSK